jgi:hypothetical protein
MCTFTYMYRTKPVLQIELKYIQIVRTMKNYKNAQIFFSHFHYIFVTKKYSNTAKWEGQVRMSQ